MVRHAVLVLAVVVVGCGAAHPAATDAGFDLATPSARTRERPAPLPSAVVVYVAGEVVHPGVYRFGPGQRVVDALHRAGDARPDADLVAVNLAEPLHDGEEVAVPAKGERAVARGKPARAPKRSRAPRRTRKRAAAPSARIDLNTADAQTLASLPGLGAGMAERIVEFRNSNGPFDSVDELADISGITDRRLEQLAPYLTVNGR